MELRSLSVSQIRTYAACGKKWELERSLHLPFRKTDSLVFGSAIHAGLEAFNNVWFSKRSKDPAFGRGVFQKELQLNLKPEILLDLFLREEERPPKDPAELAAFSENRLENLTKIGFELIEMYSSRDDHGDKSLMIEDKLEGKILDLPFSMVVDLLDEHQGKVRLRDYKSKGKLDEKLERMQFSGYVWGLREFRGITVDVIEQVNLIRTKSPKIQILTYDMKDIDTDVAVFLEEAATFKRGVEGGVFSRNRDHYCGTCGVAEACFDPKVEHKLRADLLVPQQSLQV